MPKRPQVVAPLFGLWLKAQRGTRSLAQIANAVRPLVQGVELKVDRTLIHKLEGGRVPSWPLLAALSRVYGVPILEMLRSLAGAIDFPGAAELLQNCEPRTAIGPEQHSSREESADFAGIVDGSEVAQVAAGRIKGVPYGEEAADARLSESGEIERAIDQLEIIEWLARAESLVQRARTALAHGTTTDSGVQAPERDHRDQLLRDKPTRKAPRR